MNNIFRFLKGYLVVLAYGDCVERLFTICARKNIDFWGIENLGDSIRFRIFTCDYFRIGKLAVRLKIQLKHQKRIGLYFLLQKLKKFTPLFILFILIISGMIYLKGTVWSFEYIGNETIRNDQIDKLLQQSDIKQFTPCDRIDYKMLEDDLRLAFPQITWVSAGMEENRLVIKMVEEVVPFTKEEIPYRASSLYSCVDGQLVSFITRNGTSQLKIGDYVYKNQLLVEGCIAETGYLDSAMMIKYVNAQAEITIRFTMQAKELIQTKNGLWTDASIYPEQFIKNMKMQGLKARLLKVQSNYINSDNLERRYVFICEGTPVIRKEIPVSDESETEE